jgi:hypothetical protein
MTLAAFGGLGPLDFLCLISFLLFDVFFQVSDCGGVVKFSSVKVILVGITSEFTATPRVVSVRRPFPTGALGQTRYNLPELVVLSLQFGDFLRDGILPLFVLFLQKVASPYGKSAAKKEKQSSRVEASGLQLDEFALSCDRVGGYPSPSIFPKQVPYPSRSGLRTIPTSAPSADLRATFITHPPFPWILNGSIV